MKRELAGLEMGGDEKTMNPMVGEPGLEPGTLSLEG
jgi:hypothetical protein